MKTRQNHRPVKHFAILALMAFNNFGLRTMNFINSLVTVSMGPFAGLNRGQLRQMWWLQCMYR